MTSANRPRARLLCRAWRIARKGLAFMGREYSAPSQVQMRRCRGRTEGRASRRACPGRRSEASSRSEHYEFTIRPKRMVGRGDVPQVPRRSLLGRSQLA
ncbi:hypothetical protein ACT16_11770 [Mycobacterium heckeshornense]|nr:hypothetical protein ACT16_11770 [Mycobacterium heckeshornense]